MWRSWQLWRVTRAVPILIVFFIFVHEIWKSQFTSPAAASTIHVSRSNTGPACYIKSPTSSPLSSKWLVVNPKNTYPCNRLATTFTGWTVLLVNQETPRQASHPSCLFLSPTETQYLQHRYDLTDGILAGILCALQNKAETFYVPAAGTDLLSMEYPALLNMHRKHWLTVKPQAKVAKFSSVRHFGCNASLVQQEEQTKGNIKYSIVKAPAPVVLAVTRIPLITQPWSYDLDGDRVELKVCDDSAPPVALAPGTYGDLSLTGAKVHYPAAWAFSGCVSGNENSADCLTWNFVIQNLLWKTGNTLSLFYNRSGLVSDSLQLPHSKSRDLQQFLESWEFHSESMMVCGINLIHQLAFKLYLTKDFAMKQIAWFKALNASEYHYPALKHPGENSTVISSDVIFHPVDFSGNLQWLQGRKHPFSPIANHRTTAQFHAGLCGSYSGNVSSNNCTSFPQPWMQFEDTLLLVVFNSPFYNNIRYIETMYRTMFPRILYCGPRPFNLKAFPWAHDYKFSFVKYDGDAKHTAGAFNYDCIRKVVQMNYHVSGYLVIADDLFLMPHSLQKYNKSMAWYRVEEMEAGDMINLRECRNGVCDIKTSWPWWKKYKTSTINALSALNKSLGSGVCQNCHKQLVTLNGGELRANGQVSDTYYVPARLEQQISELFGHFRQHKVFIEIAVPTVLNCLAGPYEAQNLPGRYSNNRTTRNMPWLFFNDKDLLGKRFLHPTKWSLVESSVEMKELYCSKIVPFMFDPYGKIENNGTRN